MTERLFSTYQIARLLGATLSSVVQWMDKGALNCCRMPDGSARITESALIEFLTKQGIDLGEVLTKVGYEEVAAVSSVSGLLPQTVPVETTGALTEATTEVTPPNPIDDEPDRTDDQPPEQPSAVEITPADESYGETSATQPPEATRPDLRAGQICDAILSDAARQNAQTIHLTPHRDSLVLQLRTGGVLHDKLNFDRHLPDDLRRQTIACLLNRAAPGIDPAALAVPHSVEFTQTIDGRDLRLRLSALPTAHGLRLVIHMPRQTADLELLALEDAARTRLEKLLQADGLILVAAKRQNGRDMTLRALLNAADTDGRGTIAIERNSGPDLDNVVQLQVNPAAGMTYATAMTAIEHQDADAIVLTELRDPATALKAFDAAHDGALVIAGINTNSASAAITELLAMGIEPWPLGGTLKAIVEQTSVRTPGEQSGRSDRTVLSRAIFVERQLASVIRSGGTTEQFDQAIVQSHPAQSALKPDAKTPWSGRAPRA